MSFTDPSARAADAALGRGEAVARADSRAVFGQVMGLVAVTVAFTAAGATPRSTPTPPTWPGVRGVVERGRG